MRKFRVFICISVLFVMMFSFAGCVSENSSDKETAISCVKSPDGNYNLILCQIGEPQGTFGSVKAKLVLQNSSGETVDEEIFELSNDGGGVNKDNINNVVWSDVSVEVNIRELDTDQKFTYILDF